MRMLTGDARWAALMVAVMLMVTQPTSAHVALTYPPARSYDLDFLDTSRTKPPCGMPKGSVKTTLQAGSPLDITWHLAYPHRGGFRLELLDAQEKLLYSLAPNTTTTFIATDTTAQKFSLQLDENLVCEDCSIRLIRQATEWGKNYKFWSCADVDIVPADNYVEQCSFHGTPERDICQCDKNFYGDKCQYEEECEENEDCLNLGQCVDIGGTALPRKQCYCTGGAFGPKCSKTSNIKDASQIKLDGMNLKQLSDDFTLYWGLQSTANELEVAMVVKGTSYAAVGWRPLSVTTKCREFPYTDVNKSQLSKKISGPSPYVPKREFHAMDCTDIVIGSARGNTYRINDYYTRDRSTPRLDTFWGGDDSLTAALGWEVDGQTTIYFRRKLSANHPTDYSIEVDLMHLIWARGQEEGMYVHSPKSGLEIGNPQVPNFYKPDELKYHGRREQRGTATINFYEVQEKNVNGNSQTCTDSFKHPQNCNPLKKDCEYYAEWEYIESTDDILFTIQSSHTNKWTGIAFSNDRNMAQTDAVLGWIDPNGKPVVIDTWINGYSRPVEDESQGISGISGSTVDGMTTLTFTRKRVSSDKTQDLSFTDDTCLHLIFPLRGGAVNYDTKIISRHEITPTVYKRVCIMTCVSTTVEVASSTSGPFFTTPRTSFTTPGAIFDTAGTAFATAGVAFAPAGAAFVTAGTTFAPAGTTFATAGAAFATVGATCDPAGAAFATAGAAFANAGAAFATAGAAFVTAGAAFATAGAAFATAGAALAPAFNQTVK